LQQRVASGEIPMARAVFLARHANEPTALARIETDMRENPWAYPSAEDFERNVELVAANAGIVRRPHGCRKANSPPPAPTQRMPLPAPIDVSGPRVEAESTLADDVETAAPVADEIGPPQRVAAIVAAIGELQDAGELEAVLQAARERLEQLAAAC
jgi:hypothetical protein